MTRTSRFPALLAGLALGLAALTGAAYTGAAYEAHRAAVTARVTAGIVASESAALDLGTATFPSSISFTASLTNGVGSNMADLHWTDTRTLAASATENLDFVAGNLTSAFGAIQTYAKVRAIEITASCSNTNNVEVGGGTNPLLLFKDATDVVSIRPCHVLLLGGGGPNTTAGTYPVTAATGDVLKITNSGGTTGVTYSISVLGLSS